MARSADEQHPDAVELVNHGRLSQARRLLQAAERRANDPDVAGRVAGTLAYLTARSGAVAEATRICQAALDTPGLGGHTRAILAGQMGALAEQSGQFDDAERWLALGIAGLQDDPPALANLLVNRSLVNMRRGDLAAAAQDAKAARTIFERIGSPVDEAQARHNEGYIALLEGDLVSAMRMMSAAQRELSGISAVMGAIGDVDRAEVLRDAGLTTEAERILEAAAAVFGSSRIPQARAEAEFHLARSLLMHDPPRAGRVAAAAARRFRTLGNETWAARANGIRLRAALSGGSVRQGGGRLGDPRRPPLTEEVDEAASALDELGLRNEAAALRMSYALWRARRGITAGAPIRVPASASIEVRLLAHEARAARASAPPPPPAPPAAPGGGRGPRPASGRRPRSRADPSLTRRAQRGRPPPDVTLTPVVTRRRVWTRSRTGRTRSVASTSRPPSPCTAADSSWKGSGPRSARGVPMSSSTGPNRRGT